MKKGYHNLTGNASAEKGCVQNGHIPFLLNILFRQVIAIQAAVVPVKRQQLRYPIIWEIADTWISPYHTVSFRRNVDRNALQYSAMGDFDYFRIFVKIEIPVIFPKQVLVRCPPRSLEPF